MRVTMLVVVVVVEMASLTGASATYELYRLPRSPHMLDYGTFAGKQKGNALTRGDSSSDTRTGISHADVMAALANSGSLRGGTTSRNRKGNQAMSHYSGDLAGKGGLFSDTQSLASDKGGAAHSGMKGFLTGGGEISGSSGSSSAGKGNTGSLGK